MEWVEWTGNGGNTTVSCQAVRNSAGQDLLYNYYIPLQTQVTYMLLYRSVHAVDCIMKVHNLMVIVP